MAATINCSVEAIQALLPTNISVNWAYHLPEGSTFTPPPADVQFSEAPTNLPACCVLQVEVPQPDNATFNFGMFLPNEWNGRFLTAGNAGFAGGVNWISLGDGLGYGFAVMSSDLGHNSSATSAAWAYNQPGKVIDWGYRALHESVVYAKQLITGYYGQDIAYSYYRGCSAGGKQGLKEVEMFPEDFDRVVVGAPAWWTTHLQLWNGWVGVINTPANASYYIPSSLFSVIGAGVLKQCDPQDGLKDNIIMDPRRCDFRPVTLLCGPGSNISVCLQPDQLDTLYKWYEDWTNENQTLIFPRWQLGSEWQWDTPNGLLDQYGPSTLGTDYVNYMLNKGPDWDWESEWNTDVLVALSDELNPGNATADDFDLTPFHTKGGMLLHYHGYADGSIATGSSLYFYHQVQRALVPQDIELDEFYRFYLIPGMGHCYITADYMNAPWVIGGDGQAVVLGSNVSGAPGFEDDKHDVLRAMMAWVEEGQAPTDIIATKYVNERRTIKSISRGRCVYTRSKQCTRAMVM